MHASSQIRPIIRARLCAALLIACGAAGPARAQMTEDQFLNAVMPVLTKVDFTGTRALSATWLSPEFWRHQAASDNDPDQSDGVIGQKLIAEALFFVLAPLDGKPLPGLKAASARAVLRLPDGTTLSPIRMPAAMEKEFGGGDKAGEPVMVAFPARRADGSATVPLGEGSFRLEVGGSAGKPRVFQWTLPIPYPAAARQEMERAASEHATRLDAFAPPEPQMAEAMIAWLAEFGLVDGVWVAAAWCPAEWWELNWKTDKAVDEGARAGFRLLFNDLTTFMLIVFDRKDARALAQWTKRCTLIDGTGARHAAVTLPADFQAGFAKGIAREIGKGDDMSILLVAFKVKLDAATSQPFHLVIDDPARRSPTTFRWRPPIPMPARLREALAAARPQ
jgi:hypothetical protein